LLSGANGGPGISTAYADDGWNSLGLPAEPGEAVLTTPFCQGLPNADLPRHSEVQPGVQPRS
jgi:hypothetical protein